ncbi:MAG: arsenite methyltransferase [Candidatus Eisenbacteria bacterium]
MSGNDEIRKSVSETYGKAVNAPSKRGCGCGCGEGAQKGVAAKLAGYSADELRGLPPDAVVNSFGCGNPLAFMEVEEGEVVLDLGAGAGIDILLAAKKVGPSGRAIGIDMTGEMIERARRNIAASGLRNAEVRKGLIEEMPVEDSSVDWVISNCVINLSPEKERVFAEIARVLRPGGRMLVSDMVVEDMPAWLRGVQDLYGSCISGAISEGEYVRGLESAGLVDVEVRERQVYDTSALEAFIVSEVVPGAEEARKALAPVASERIVRRAAADLQGKLASIQVFARKPGE